MPGIGIGLGLGLGGGGAGAWSEAGIAAALAGRGLSDAQARAAIGAAASLPAGLRTVGLLPAVPSAPGPTPAPTATALPAGIAEMWDAASLSGLADGAAVTTWTGASGSVAASTGGATPCSFVADSGGLPAVRVHGSDVLATSGGNAAATAMTGAERSMIVVARAIRDRPAGSANPCIASCGSDTALLFEADAGSTGFFGRLTDCADAGMRTIAYAHSNARDVALDGVNGSALSSPSYQGAGGQIAIGGWQSAGGNTGRADILAVIIWNRALTAAEFKAVHRHYCERLGQPRPGGGSARVVSFIGDSLTEGTTGGLVRAQSYPGQMVAALGLPWGTWDQLGVGGFTWTDIRTRAVPLLGDVSAATGTRSVVCAFEWANMRTAAAASVAAAARATIDALHAQDPMRDVIFGTSTDDGSTTGVATQAERATYNAYWDDAANRTGIAAYVPLHRDAAIGLVGAAPTSGGNGYYLSDGIHHTAAGYALIDAGPYGFRAAVSARLAA